MKKSLAVGLMIAICSFTASAAQAEDSKVKEAGKKVGNAIVWPFKSSDKASSAWATAPRRW